MKSNRLSKKALLDLGGCSILERVVINLRASKYIDEVIITTTTSTEDDPIEEFSRQKKIALFRGSENNVLNRYWDAAKLFGADIIVRATGDNPFVSYEIADFLIKNHISNNSDFTGIERDKIPITRKYSFTLKATTLNAKSIRSADLVLLATDHDAFDYRLIQENANLIVDTRGRLNNSPKVIKA